MMARSLHPLCCSEKRKSIINSTNRLIYSTKSARYFAGFCTFPSFSPPPNPSMKLLTAVAGLVVAVESAALAPLGSQFQNALQSVLSLGESNPSKPPNILFVITDDQDLGLDSISYTPLIEKHLRQKGTFFRNHFVTTALCCPSRVSLWTGRQAHNTNVTDVNPPYGERPLEL